MKKIYLLFALLLSFAGATQVVAQEEEAIVLEISKKTGNWTASGSPAYANEYATTKYSATEENSPGVRIQHWDRGGGHRNNMYFYDGTNLGIYSAFGSTVSEDYRIYPSKGYYVYGISLDFIPGKHPNFAMNGVRVWAAGEEENAVTSPDADTPGHYEIEGLLEDDEYVALTIGQLAEGGNPIFAHTYNFTVTLKKKEAFSVAVDDLMKLATSVQPYTAEGTTPFIGDGKPGNYGEAEVIAFNGIYDFCIDEDNWASSESVELVKSLKEQLQAAYDAVLASKVKTFNVPDGYYQVRTGLIYNDNETKYIYVVPNSDGTINGRWGTLTEEIDACQSLFKLTNEADGTIDLVSMATDARFNNNAGTLSMTSENRWIVEPAATIEDQTYVNILLNGKESGSYNYIHQAGHGSGSGAGGNLTAWSPSYPAATTNLMGGSEWVFEPVDAEAAAEIIAAYQPIKERNQLISNFKSLLAEAKTAVTDAKDIQEYNEVIKETSQFSSPWTEPSEGSLDNLLDGNLATYWHSAWSGGSVPNHTHYLEVALAEPLHELVQMRISRRAAANDHVTLWGVFGSNEQDVAEELYTEDDPEVQSGEKQAGEVKVEGKVAEWTELASLSTPYGNNTETKISDDFDTKEFKYLRFYIDGTTSNRGYGHVSEFQLVIPVPNPKAQFGFMGEVATNLDNLLREYKDIVKTDEDITAERYEALVEAYDAFKALYVDPTELRELLANVEGIAKGVTVGTAPGYWPDTSTGDALKATFDAAKAYDEAGVYVAATSNQYIETLKAQAEAVQNAAIKVQEGKWYRIHFMSKETAEANQWDVENNEPVVVTTTDGDVVTNEALWEKYITVAKLEPETITVSIPPAEEGGEATDREITINHIVAYDEDSDVNPADIRTGDNLYLDADADIVMKDLSMFRFVLVGDSAFVMQNKATGLYLNSQSGVKLGITPSLYSVSAVGYGQNVISAKNLQGASQSNFNAQRTQNRLVMYGETTAGSRSAFYIEEAGAVESDYDGSEFVVDINPGEIYSLCYPVDLSVKEDEAGKIYVASELEVSEDAVKVTLAPVEGTLPAGHPFFYIYDDPSVYNPETPAEVMTFQHGSTFVAEPLTKGFMLGTFAQKNIGEGYVVTGGSLRDYLGQYASEEIKRNEFYVSSKFITNSVPAYNAYICWTELLSDALNVSVELSEQPIEVGVAQVQQLQQRQGELYTIDGRLVSRNVSFSNLKRFGKGLYILNGMKVVVK